MYGSDKMLGLLLGNIRRLICIYIIYTTFIVYLCNSIHIYCIYIYHKSCLIYKLLIGT